MGTSDVLKKDAFQQCQVERVSGKDTVFLHRGLYTEGSNKVGLSFGFYPTCPEQYKDIAAPLYASNYVVR